MCEEAAAETGPQDRYDDLVDELVGVAGVTPQRAQTLARGRCRAAASGAGHACYA